MVHSLSIEAAASTAPALEQEEQRRLLAIARMAIARGPRTDEVIEMARLPTALHCERAVFVTLTLNGGLRGCIGSLLPSAPLAIAVAEAARAAAHSDPRFPPLGIDERPATRIEISILSALERIAVGNRQALLDALRPGVDGLLLEEGHHRSTFLPKVWDQLPNAGDFLSQLLAKAGLPEDHWAPSIRVHRYTASSFAETDASSSN